MLRAFHAEELLGPSDGNGRRWVGRADSGPPRAKGTGRGPLQDEPRPIGPGNDDVAATPGDGEHRRNCARWSYWVLEIHKNKVELGIPQSDDAFTPARSH